MKNPNLFSYDGSNDLSSGECYNPMSNTWNYITPMGTRRSCLGIAAYDGLVRYLNNY